ncbi:MAG: small multi-drug export protein [Candidatus Methanoperedenaceae archaeon]|nr:small multi-drug export protein [Candidatus Methanoperedenaceae archaeon]
MTIESVLLDIFSFIPNRELIVVLIAMLPLAELRVSIPIAIYAFELDPFTAFYLSVIGNMIPVIPLLLFLEPVSNYLRRWRIGDIFFTWLFERTQRKHNANFEKYGSIGLAIFVGIPLPVTGAWTGCAAAFVFGFKFKNAFLAILAGVIIAGAVVTTLTYMGIKIFI